MGRRPRYSCEEWDRLPDREKAVRKGWASRNWSDRQILPYEPWIKDGTGGWTLRTKAPTWGVSPEAGVVEKARWVSQKAAMAFPEQRYTLRAMPDPWDVVLVHGSS